MSNANSATNNGTTPNTNGFGHPDQGSIVEPRPITGMPAAEEMFLSPRVIDASAFARYSDSLKSIITQANLQSRTLEEFSTDAHAMIKRCESTSESINVRMQAGVRMLKMIDERAQRTDLLLDKVQAAQPDSELLTKQIDAMIEQRLATTQLQVDKILDLAIQRIEQAETRTQEALAQSNEYAHKLAQLSSKVDGQMSELEARIEQTRKETNNTLTTILDRTNTVTTELDSSINQVISRSHEAGANLASKIDEASMLTDARIAQLSKSMEPILESSHQAMITLGMDPQNPNFSDSPLSRIEQLVERGDTQLASLDRVYRQLEDLQSQAEGVRSMFGNWLVDAAGELDVLESRKDTLVGPMSEAADKIASIAPDCEDKLELASTKLSHLQIEQKVLRQAIQASSEIASEVSGRMTNESGQLQALLDGSLHKLSTRVEQAGVWLGALIQRAESIGASLPQAGQMEFGNHVTPTSPVPTAAPTPTPIQAPIPAPISAPTPIPAQSIEPVTHNEPKPSTNRPLSISEPLRTIQSTQSSPTVDETPIGTPRDECVEEFVLELAHDLAQNMNEDIDEEFTEAMMDPSDHSESNPLKQDTIAPTPPCLPIDAISFDGASFVIEHDKN